MTRGSGSQTSVALRPHAMRERRQLNIHALGGLNKFVYLDLDYKTVKDPYDRWVAIIYLANSDGSLNHTRNFNRMLVDSDHAVIEDFKNSELDPQS